MPKATGRPFDENELIAQIGKMNIFAISGGRVGVIVENGETVAIEMPVSQGYWVVISLGWDDTWTVTRQYVRKGVVTDKGTLEGVYADQVGEIAYQASCYKNVEFAKSA
jgi:kynurenine formamidase